MTRRRTQGLLFSALLALVAIVGMTALSGWHGAVVHQHGTAPVELSHAAQHDGQDDVDNAAHGAAHAVVQGVALPSTVTPPLPAFAATPLWSGLRDTTLTGREPRTILRPPRA